MFYPESVGLICALILAGHVAVMVALTRSPLFRNNSRRRVKEIITWIPIVILTGIIIRAFPLPLSILAYLLPLAVGVALGSITNWMIDKRSQELSPPLGCCRQIHLSRPIPERSRESVIRLRRTKS